MKDSPFRITVTVMEGPDRGKSFELTTARHVIGRHGADLLVSDKKASQKHASFEIENDKVTLTDLNSTNGIMVNGQEVKSCVLKNLDEIQMGLNLLRIVIVEDLEAFRARNSSAVIEKEEETEGRDLGRMIDDELRRFSKWDLSHPADETIMASKPLRFAIGLEVIGGPETGRTIRIQQERTTIGRGKADIHFNDADMSRVHSEIELMGGKAVIRDLKSTNGIYVNGKKVSRATLETNDQIQIGGTVFRFVAQD